MPSKTRKVVELAQRLETDIHARNLQPGDRYFSTIDAAKMLRVDTATANRALQLLVKRNVIRRRQRVGTFIADNKPEDTPVLDQIHLMTRDDYPRIEGWLNPDAMLALQSELPNVRIQFHSVPQDSEKEYMNDAINAALKAPYPEGFVLTRSSLLMQRMMQASGLPVAVFGHPYPSLRDMPFVDRDQKQIGRLSAEYLLRRGHRRIAVLMRQRMLPGDHLLIEGAREAAADGGLGAGDFLVYCLSPDDEEVRCAVGSILESQVNQTGFIARSPNMARITWELLERAGVNGSSDASLVVTDYFGAAPLPYPHIATQDTVDSQGRRLGRLIHNLACGRPFSGEGHLVPVMLCE